MSRQNSRLTIIAAVASGLSFVVAPARAPFTLLAQATEASPAEASTAAQQEEKKLPILAGHQFLSSGFVPDPFVTTFIRNAVGGGVALNIESVLRDTAGNVIAATEGDIAFMNVGFQYQLALANWVAVRLQLAGAARVGTSTEALLSNGVSAVYGYALGGTFRLFESNRTYLSATADLTGNKIYDIGILQAIQDAIDSGIEPDSIQAVESGTDKSAVGGLQFAWAASRLVGVRLLGSIGIGEPFRDLDESETSVNGGAAIDFNLFNTSSVPLGFLLGWTYSSFSEAASNVAEGINKWGLEVDWTGARDFSLGLQLSYNRVPLRDSDETINSWEGLINLRYYF